MDLATVDDLLTTTRAVRKRLQTERPVDPALLRECLEVAVQAPTGSNVQDWHFLVVTDPQRRAALADLYRESYRAYRSGPAYAGNIGADDPDRAEIQQRVAASADHLAEHLHEVPVLLIPCIARRLPPSPSSAAMAGLFGSILPAVWSFMLAARARGLGTVWTSMHLNHEERAAQVLGLPFPAVTQTGLIPVAHYRGESFRPAPRRPLGEVVSENRFGHVPTWL